MDGATESGRSRQWRHGCGCAIIPGDKELGRYVDGGEGFVHGGAVGPVDGAMVSAPVPSPGYKLKAACCPACSACTAAHQQIWQARRNPRTSESAGCGRQRRVNRAARATTYNGPAMRHRRTRTARKGTECCRSASLRSIASKPPPRMLWAESGVALVRRRRC
jgi:hypothetical protein